MDLTSIVLPGAQTLVSSLMSEAWTHTRSALSRLWASQNSHSEADEDHDTEAYDRQLDAAKQQAIVLAGDGTAMDRAARMELFWAGYLSGQLASRPELADGIRALPGLFGNQQGQAKATTVHNTVSGTVNGRVIQAGDIHGNIS